MSRLAPTYGIFETGRNVRQFVKENRAHFWNALKPLLPWIIGLHIVDVAINVAFPVLDGDFRLGAFLSAYFYACFCITVHRVALSGPENARPVQPFKPEKSDLVFMGMGIALFMGLFLAVLASVVLSMKLEMVGGIMGIVLILTAIAVLIKLLFYFPSKAVNGDMSLKQSFKATDGYFIKLVFAPLVASVWILFQMALYLIAAALVMTLFLVAMGDDPATMTVHVIAVLGGFFLSLPIMLYFQPMSYALGVGVLSNYYQHCIQNKPLAT